MVALDTPADAIKGNKWLNSSNQATAADVLHGLKPRKVLSVSLPKAKTTEDDEGDPVMPLRVAKGKHGVSTRAKYGVQLSKSVPNSPANSTPNTPGSSQPCTDDEDNDDEDMFAPPETPKPTHFVAQT